MDIKIFTQYYGFDWLALMIGVVGIWKLGSKKRSGFLFYIAAAASGFIFAVLANSVAYMVVNIITIVLQLRGYLKWRRDELKQNS
ncbi:MAG: hypothetical protein V1716_05055 [Candidatus Uhrbacteria bacterium]